MKLIWKLNLVIVVIFVLQACMAQNELLHQSYENGATAQISGHVVDEENNPLVNATVHAMFRSMGTGKDFEVWAETDCNGRFGVSHKTNWKVEIWVRKDGYYASRFEVSFLDVACTNVEKGNWITEGLDRKIVLRKVNTQRTLSVFSEAKRMGTWKIPVMDKWVGFDFSVFDWSKPHGRGKHDDVLLRFSAKRTDHMHGRYQMEVCFTNNLHAGAYIGKAEDRFSDLKIPHVADRDRKYSGYFCFTRNRLGLERVDSFPKKNEYVVFRTRTRVDANGALIGACYGVISGIWISSDTMMRIEDAAFNLVENDADIEDGYYLRQLLRQYDMERK